MYLLLLIGSVLALPAPLIGPDGPVWFGPLPPPLPGDRAQDPRSTVVVDPTDGSLFVRGSDAPGVIREWNGRRWMVDGVSIDESWPTRDGFSYELEDGELVAVTGTTGIRERYLYDGAGYLVGIHWPDGSQVRIGYDSRARVEEIAGPGPERIRFDWSDTVRVQDLLGRELEFRSISAGSLGDVAWEVEDDLGRVARSWFEETEGGESRIVAWQDPRGFTTRLEWDDDELEIVGGGGAIWRLEFGDENQIESLRLPGGENWSWTYDERRYLVSLTEPGGRVTRWERNAAGFVIRTLNEGRPTRYLRDSRGRVIRITDPSGAEINISRNTRGHIETIDDPLGNEIRFGRYRSGQPLYVVGRTGGRWTFSLDLLGRIDRVVDPTDRIVEISRSGAGLVDRILDRRYGTVQLRRSISGDITQIENTAGHRTGFVRSPTGAIEQLIRGDGSVVEFDRDVVGNLETIRFGDEQVEIERNLRGFPTRAGDVRWSWSATGWLESVEDDSLRLDFDRSFTGALTEVRSGNWRVDIERDDLGFPVRWDGTDGTVEVVRNLSGIIVEETIAGEQMDILRDPRGMVQRVEYGEMEWRWGRDACGRTLVAQGPEGLRTGFDRDLAGRVTLMRYPGGSLVRRQYSADVVHDELLDSDGGLLLQRSSARTVDGRTSWTQQGEAGRQLWRYDPLDQLIAIEMDEGAWSWSLDAIQGPGSELTILDVDGHLSEAFPPQGPPAWGVANRVLAAFRDDRDRLSTLRGELGDATLAYDRVGRLQSVALSEGNWRVRYDARGRVRTLVSPAGRTRRVIWTPDGTIQGLGALPLATGVNLDRAWLVGPTGVSAMHRTGQTHGVVSLEIGRPIWVLDETGYPLEIETTPMGFSNSAPLGILGPFGTIQLFAGGPLIRDGHAIEPLSGHPVTGVDQWPWAPRPVVHDGASTTLDPSGWMPRDPWSDPIAMLLDLGLLDMGEAESWTRRADIRAGIDWLPDAIDSYAPPVGPRPNDLPFSEDPVSTAFLLSSFPGVSALDVDDPLEVILQEAIVWEDLPSGLGLSILGFEIKEGPSWLAPWVTIQ